MCKMCTGQWARYVHDNMHGNGYGNVHGNVHNNMHCNVQRREQFRKLTATVVLNFTRFKTIDKNHVVTIQFTTLAFKM